MLESAYQARLIRRLEQRFPGCMILKNDSSYRQGIPDLTLFHDNHWAMLEVKSSAKAPREPNQDYYIRLFDAMSFAAFIYPENEEEVLDAIQRSFNSRRPTRFPQREQLSLDQLQPGETRRPVRNGTGRTARDRTSRLRS